MRAILPEPHRMRAARRPQAKALASPRDALDAAGEPADEHTCDEGAHHESHDEVRRDADPRRPNGGRRIRLERLAEWPRQNAWNLRSEHGRDDEGNLGDRIADGDRG